MNNGNKMGWGQRITVIGASIILLVAVGTSCVQDLMTPAYVNKDAAKWAGVPTKLWSWQPYTTLWDVKRVLWAMEFKYAQKEVEYQAYGLILRSSKIAATELRDTVFSPTGPLAGVIGVSGLAVGSLLIPRPKDRKKITELEIKNGKRS